VWTEVGNQAPCNGIAVQPVEGVADAHEVEDALECYVLGRGGDPPDVRDSETLPFSLAELDRLRFLVDGPDLAYQGRQPPYDTFWGARYAVLADPDGNDVGIMSPVDESRRFWPPKESPDR
jgi:hypothetical protein